MRKQLKRISPLRAGLVLGITYGLLGLIAMPIFFIAAAASAKTGGPAALGGAALGIFVPIFYAIGGFIGGIIMAAIYNLVAKWTGGLEFDVEDITPTM